jgi:hypothetical protein
MTDRIFFRRVNRKKKGYQVEGRMERPFDGYLPKFEDGEGEEEEEEGRTGKVEGAAEVEVKWAEIKGKRKGCVNCKGACISLLCVCVCVCECVVWPERPMFP